MVLHVLTLSDLNIGPYLFDADIRLLLSCTLFSFDFHPRYVADPVEVKVSQVTAKVTIWVII